MDFTIYDWLVFLTVPAIAWMLGRRGGPKGTLRAYFLASQQLSATGVAATYFGANLTFTTVFLLLSNEAYKRGAWVFAVPVMWLLGTGVFLLCYPKLRPFIQKGMTLHQALGDSFQSPKLQQWASFWTILAFVGTVALEFYGGMLLLRWFRIPLLQSVGVLVMMVGLVASFTALGGLRGVARADKWLDAVTIVAAVVLFSLLAGSGGMTLDASPPIGASVNPIPSLGNNIGFVIGMGFIFIPFSFCTLDSWQRLGAWRNREGSPALLLTVSAFALCAIYCVPILVGISGRHAGIALSPGESIIEKVLSSHRLWVGILGLLSAGFMAAILSTADELLNCCSFSFIFDLLGLGSPEKNTPENERRLITSAKFYTIVFGVLAGLIALLSLKFEREISDLAVVFFSGQVVFTIPLVFTLFSPEKCRGLGGAAIACMISAFVVMSAAVVRGWALGDHETVESAPIYGFFAGAVVFFVLWLKTRFRKET